MASPFNLRHQPGFAIVALVCLFVLYLPMAALVVFAFNAANSVAVLDGFSLRWFVKAWQNTQVQDAALRSFGIAIVASTVASIVATLTALATTRVKPYPGMGLKNAVMAMPLMVPEIVTAVALLIVFAQLKVWTGYTGIGYLLLAHAAFCTPFAFMPIRARLENMDLTLETAAADLYASRWRTFYRVTLPLIQPGILAGFSLAFVISLDDVVITELIKSGGQDTLPTYMLGQLRRIVTPEINAIATVLLALSILIVTVFFYLSRKRQ